MSVAWWRKRLYPDARSQDPVARFAAVLDRYIEPGSRVLDLGAGAGAESPYRLKSRVRAIVGIDLDPRVGRNPLLHHGLVAHAGRLPFRESAYDAAFSIYVLEHIEDPRTIVAELRRVLRPGGLFLALTPNRYHYVALVSALTPTSFHKWLNERRGRKREDTFPTHYRMNSRAELRRLFAAHGFEPVELRTFEVQPHYLMFSTPSFLLGAAYERAVNASEGWADLRVNIICVFRKRG